MGPIKPIGQQPSHVDVAISETPFPRLLERYQNACFHPFAVDAGVVRETNYATLSYQLWELQLNQDMIGWRQPAVWITSGYISMSIDAATV